MHNSIKPSKIETIKRSGRMPSIIVRTKEAGMAGYPVVRTLDVLACHDLPCPSCCLAASSPAAGGLLHPGRRF